MPLSTMSYPTRSFGPPRFLSNLTADMREEDDEGGEAELDSALTYEGFESEHNEPKSRSLRNGNGQMARRDLYFAGRDTEKMVV